MTKQLILIYLFFFSVLSVFASNLRIRIYTEFSISSISFKPVNGNYTVTNYGSKHKLICNTKRQLSFKLEDNRIRIYDNDIKLGGLDSIIIKGSGIMCAFSLKPDDSSIPGRIYNDNLIIKIKKDRLILINVIELERYIPGVVEAESGYKNGQAEFYKMQSIICRTYAIKNARKHLADGYNLCDREHCQVYKGRSTNTDILLAVTQTAGSVIVDRNEQLIDAAFHANCGGQTVNCEDVWSKSAPYLRSVPDTFCLHMAKAQWQKTIAKKDLINYLAKNNIKDTTIVDSLMKFSQPSRKSVFFDTIKLKQVRSYFDLRSAYFSIIPKGDSLLFKGRGNGHGIGLCQEGAMNMVVHGYTYNDIINHYYKNVHIINYNKNYSQKASNSPNKTHTF